MNWTKYFNTTIKKEMKEIYLINMMTPALRSMIFADHVASKMWERNGSSIMRQQIDNYRERISVLPLFRDSDFRCVQLCALTMDPMQFLFHTMDQYEILPWLQSTTTDTDTVNDDGSSSSNNKNNSNTFRPGTSDVSGIKSSLYRRSSFSIKGSRKKVEFAIGGSQVNDDTTTTTSSSHFDPSLHIAMARKNSKLIKNDDEYMVPLMDAYLLFVIRFVTEILPSTMSENHDDYDENLSEFVKNENMREKNIKIYIKRELIQKLSTGPQTLSNLRNQCKCIG
jgi:hypothetical protein